MKKKKFEPIDLIIVNFYPFEKTLQKKEFENMIKKRNKSNSDFIVLQFDFSFL